MHAAARTELEISLLLVLISDNVLVTNFHASTIKRSDKKTCT